MILVVERQEAWWHDHPRLLEAGNEVAILVRRNSPSEELARQGMATPPARSSRRAPIRSTAT